MGETSEDAGPAAGRPAADGAEAAATVASTMAATLALARALLYAGHRIDLAGIEREVAELCAEAVALPRAMGRELRPALEGLLGEVEALEAELALRPPGTAPAA